MEADKRINWIEARILYSLKPFTSDINCEINLPNNRPLLTAFLRRSSRRLLEISSSSLGDVSFSHSTTSKNIVKSQYFIKYPHINIVQRKDLHESILSVDITSASIQDIDWIILNLFVPCLLCGDQNKVLSPLGNVFDVARAFISTLSPDFSLPQFIIPRKFHQFTPHLPSLFEELASSWLCAIRYALVSPVDNYLISNSSLQTSPLHEIRFLKQKVKTYAKICDLFRSEIFMYVYEHLKGNNSWMIKTIQDLYENTNELLNESKEILVYLYPLEKWMYLCLDHSAKLRHKYIKPICKIVYLLWTECTFYRDQSHFNSLLADVIGFVIELVRDFFSEDLFSIPLQSIDKIQTALLSCYAFQGSYVDAKIEADHHLDKFRDEMRLEFDALPEALRSKHELDKIKKSLPCKWPSRKHKIYQNFAKTVNRLQDLLEIVKTRFDFEDIKEIIQNGKEFSETFNEYLGDIYYKFLACMKPILKIETTLFEIDKNENFELIFFSFRNQIEGLEGRIISTLKSYLVPSCDLLNLRKMLLFESLLNRPKIRVSMLEFFSKLIGNLRCHISDIQSLVSGLSDSRGFHHFAPTPISKFLYIQALVHRLETPYKLLLQISPDLFHVSESHFASEAYNSTRKELKDLLNDFQFIQPNVSEDLYHLLRSPVLVRAADNQTPIPSFQPWILHNLYIAEYIVKLGYPTSLIPKSIQFLLDQSSNLELYPQISKLFHIIHKFDKIWSSRTSPKYRLFTQQIQDCKQLVERGLTEVTWESVVLKDFLQQFVSAVFTNLDNSLNQAELAINSIKTSIHSWCSQSNNLFDTGSSHTIQPLSELSQRLKVNYSEYDSIVIRSQEKIHETLTNLSNSFYISTNSAQWKHFLQYIDQIVYRGITSQTLKSLSSIQHYLSPLQDESASVSTHGLFSMNLKITSDTLSFNPSPYPKGQSPSLIEQIKLWITGVYKRNVNIHPFALPKYTFIESLKNDSFFTNLINDFDFILMDDLNNCHIILHKFSQYAFLWQNDCNSYFRAFISARPNSPDSSTLSASGEMQALDTSQSVSNSSSRLNEYAFLYPNLYAQTQGAFKGKLPMLDDFEKEISIYSSLKQELLKMPQYINMGTVVIDVRCFRSFLLSLCANWVYTFCDYLQDKVILVLEDINFLVEKIEPEVCKIGQRTTDMSQLLTNMRIFHNMRNKKSDIKQTFSTLQRANAILERFEFTLRPDIHEFYLTTPRKLDHFKAAFEMAMQNIRPFIASNKSAIINKLRAFQEEITMVSTQFYRSDLFNSDCPSKDARELIEEFGHKISDLQDKSKDLCELQSFLDTPLVNLASVQKLLDSYKTIRKVWLLVEEVTHTTKHLKRDMWKKQVPEDILKKIQELMDKVEKLPKEAIQWDITVSIIDYLEELKGTFPLLKLLQTPTIRDRHWKLILKLSPKPRVGSATITDASILIKLSFGKLIDLGLHHCLQQVAAIVEKSKTEVTSESIIRKFEAFWFGYIFKLEEYVRPTPPQSVLGHESELSIPSSNSSNENIPHTSSGTIRRHSKVLHTSRLSGINSIGLPEAPAAEPIVKLSNVNEIFENLDSHLTELETVLSSPTSLSFQSDLKPWQLKFHRTETVLKMWIETQENWMLADKFFSWSDIRQQLSQEAIGFIVVDKQWRKLMKELQTDPHVLRACYKEGRLTMLEEINQSLEQTRVAIYKYFEHFKSIYPRFYFISSAQIQSYIANLNDLSLFSRTVHMLFPGVFELDFNTRNQTKPTITGVVTTNGSSLQFNSPMHLHNYDKVTSFLNEFSNNLHDTLKDYFSSSIDKITSEKPFDQLDISQITYFLLSEMSQARSSEIFLLFIRVIFSSLLQRSVSSNDVSQLKYTLSNFEKLTILVYRFLNDDSLDALSWFSDNITAPDDAEHDETSFQQEAISMPVYLRIQNFLVTLFYFKGVTQSLLAIEGDLERSFEWQSCVKHFIQEDKTSCAMSINRITVPYGFEFQGDFKEIVLTPSTDRCYSHLLQAVSTNYGGLLVGKQGSGKISTIKQFCYLMGRSMFEYSCSSHSSIEYLKDFITGANTSKEIVCFRCIDNLPPNLMSIFVELIRGSFSGSLTNKVDSLPHDSFNFSRGIILATAQQYNMTSINSSVAVNVFIPHILMPDVSAITQFLLYISGFQFAQDLAMRMQKFYEIYSILVDAMPQSHFSIFKLRHLLIIASNKLANNPFTYVPSAKLDLRSSSLTQPLSNPEFQLEEISQRPKSTQRLEHDDLDDNQDENDSIKEKEELKKHEFEIFRYSLIDYMPSLTGSLQETQISEVNGIILKLFSSKIGEKISLHLSPPDENEFSTPNESLQKVLKLLKLEPDERFTTKVGEVWNALKLHHMVFLLGPSSSGKTSAIKVCSSLFTDLNHSAVVHTILPQAIGGDKIFGTFDAQQQSWTKGLLTSLFSNCFFSSTKNELDTRTHYWFHLDGSLDRMHCDVLSTFNFEDYTLTLPSKQNVSLLPNARIILESDHSEFLTPAMIAKLGIISFGSVLSWEIILRAWLATQNETDSSEWKYLFEKYINVIMTCLYPNGQESEQRVLRKLSSKTRKNLNRTQFTFAVHLSQFSFISSLLSLLNSLIISAPKPSKSFKEVLLNFATVWAIGGCLNEQSRLFFNDVWLELFQGPNTYPIGSNIWSYIPSPESQTFVTPRSIPFTYSKENLFRRMPFISDPEAETVFCFLEYLSANNVPILISGDLGSGKSLLVEHLFKSLESSDFDQRYTLTYRCNASSSSSLLWNDLKSKLVWNPWNGIYVPDNKMKLHYLIEDVHLIDVPNQETNSVTEMLRWIASGRELFDFETFSKKKIDLVNFVVTCNSQLTNHNSRFTKHFFIHHFQYPSFSSQLSIFGQLLSWYFNCSPNSSKSGITAINPNFIKSIVSLSVELQSSLKNLFVQTQERSLYIFTLRDIGNLFRSMCLILDVNCSIKDFIQLWNHEVYWTYEQRLVNSNDIAQFSQLKRRLIPKYFDNNAIKNYLAQPLEQFTFVKSVLEHLTIPQSLLSEYRAFKDKDRFQDLVNRPFMKHSIKNWFALPFTLDLLNRIALYLFSPPDVSNLLIIGKSQIASTVSLAASTFNFTLERISYHFASHSDESKSSVDHCTYLRTSAYNRNVFDNFMKDLYTRAGINMEKIVLLLDYRELKNKDFFLRILEFVDNCQLSHLFSLEQRGNIVNALRTHVLQMSGVFSESLAWRIFLDNVRNNLKIIINVKRLDIQFYHIVYSMPSLFNRLRCIRCSPWSNTELGILCEYSLKHYFPHQLSLKPKLQNIIIDLLPILLTDLCNNLNYNPIDIPGNDSFYSFIIKFCKCFSSIYSKVLAQQKILQCAIQNLESIEKGKETIELEYPNREFVYNDKKASCTDFIQLIGQQSLCISESEISLQRLEQNIGYLIKMEPKLSDALHLAHLESKNKIDAIINSTKGINSENIEWLKAHSKDPELANFLTVFISLFKVSQDTLPLSRTIRRLLSNSDRFISQILDFHNNNKTLSESTLVSIHDILTQDISTGADDLGADPGRIILVKICQWLRAIAEYYDVILHKLRPLEKRIERNQLSIEQLKNAKEALEVRISTLSETKSNLHSSLFQSSLSLTHFVNLYQEQNEDLKIRSSLIGDLGTLPEVWQKCSQISDEETISLIIATAFSYGYVSFLSTFPVEDQMNILLHVWPLSLAKLNLNCIWSEALNSRFNNLLGFDNLAHVMTSCKSEASNRFLQYINALCYFIYNDNIKEYLTPLKPIIFTLSKKLLRSSFTNWFSISSSSPYSISLLTNIPTHSEIDLINYDTHLYDNLRDAIVKGQPLLVKHLNTMIDPVLNPLFALAFSLSQERKENVPTHLAGRTIIPQKNFKLFFSRNTPSFCYPSIFSNSTYHINLSPSHLLCHEVCLQIMLTNHSLYPSWTDLFSFITVKESKIQSILFTITSNLAESFRCDINTGTSYMTPDSDISNVAYQPTQDLVILMRLRPYIQQLRDYTEKSVKSVYTQLSCIPDSLAKLACSLCCIQEMQPYYFFDFDLLYAIMKDLFLDHNLDQIRPSNLSQRPALELDELTNILGPELLDAIVEEYHTEVNWPDDKHFDKERQPTQSLNEMLSQIVSNFVQKAIGIYLPFLTQHDQFVFLVISSLIVSLAGVEENYSSSLIYSIIQILSNSSLQSNNALTKISKPDWIGDIQWLNLINTPLSESCTNSLLHSFTDQRTEWKDWIDDNSLRSHKNMPIQVSESNCILPPEALLVLQAFFPSPSHQDYSDFINDTLNCDFVSSCTHPISFFLAPTEVETNIFRSNIFYFVTEKNSDVKALTLQNELISFSASQGWEVKIFTHLEISLLLPNLDDDPSTNLIFIKDFHLIRGIFRETFFTKAFTHSNKLIKIILCGNWSEDFPESLPEIINVVPIENIDFHLFSNVSTAVHIYPNVHHLFECIFKHIPKEIRQKITQHPFEQICYFLILFHCSLITGRNCYFQSSHSNISITLLSRVLEDFIQLKTDESDSHLNPPRDDEILAIISSVYALTTLSPLNHCKLFSEQVLGIPLHVVDDHLRKNSHQLLPATNYFSKLGNLIKKKFSITTDCPVTLYTPPLPLLSFPKVKYLPFSIPILFVELERALKLLAPIPNELTVTVEKGSPLFYYVITSELRDVHKLLLDLSGHYTSLQHYLKTGLAFIPKKLIQIADSLSRQQVFDEFYDAYSPPGRELEFYSWLKRLVDHFYQLRKWTLHPLNVSSALDLSCFNQVTLLIDSLLKETQFSDIYSDIIITQWRSSMNFEIPINKKYILNVRGYINTFTNCIYTRMSPGEETNVNIPLLAVPCPILKRISPSSEERVLNLKTDSHSTSVLCSVSCSHNVTGDLTSS